MALLKTITVNDTGIDATYWRLAKVSVDLITGDAKITMAGYVSDELRLAGKKPILTKVIMWDKTENPITVITMSNGTAFALAYAKIKQPLNRPVFDPRGNYNPFEGAADV